MAHHRTCPKCASWRAEIVGTASFGYRLLRVVNQRLYRCRDCHWQGIAKEKETGRIGKPLFRPSASDYIQSVFLVLMILCVVSTVMIALGGNPPPSEGLTDASAAVRGVSGPSAGDSATNPAMETPARRATAPAEPPLVQNPKVIGNSDSKRYHLPGMKYYQLVQAYHRVEFTSEAEAARAGYHKAPR